MIPELGHFALILATLVALILGTLPLLGAPLVALALLVWRRVPEGEPEIRSIG